MRQGVPGSDNKGEPMARTPDQTPSLKSIPFPLRGRGILSRVKAATDAFWKPSLVPFGPGYPMTPTATPIETADGPRLADYLVGRNLLIQPRSAEVRAVTYPQLRTLSRMDGVLRTVIEKRKDEIRGLEWGVFVKDKVLRREPSANEKYKDDVDAAEVFLEKPDRQNPFDVWIGAFCEDVFVIDAPTIWPETDRIGRPMSLQLVDGATITVLVDDAGRVPMSPQPAYQQIIKGRPDTWWTNDELYYRPSNLTSQGVYGWSHVEDIIYTINLSLRRTSSLLAYFTEGNVPQGFLGAPAEWTPQQLKDYYEYVQVWLGGDLAKRASIIPTPGDPKYVPVQQLTFDAIFDEWIARVVCARFGVSPAPYVRMMNRACYSMDTETLTEAGWKRFDDITETERIATYNPESTKLEYHPPTQRYLYPYDGPMVQFKTSGVDVSVTPEHKMWGRESHHGATPYHKFAAAESPKNPFKFLAALGWDGEERESFILPEDESRNKGYPQHPPMTLKMDDWLEMLGYYLSEGGLSHAKNHYMFTLAQKEGPKADRIGQCLNRLPFKYSRNPRLDKGIVRWNVYGRQLAQYLMRETGGYANTKRIPREFMNLSQRQLGILFDALMLGDGSKDSRPNRTSMSYYSTSKQLADDMQEVAMKCGKSANLISYQDKREGIHHRRHRNYRVLIADRKEHSLVSASRARTPSSISSVPNSDGRVYCFDVPNHLFVTRRNGKIGIHGNTAESIEEAATDESLIPLMRHIKRLIDDIFAKVLKKPHLEFRWTSGQLSYRLQDAQIAAIEAEHGVRNIDEWRIATGKTPLENGLGKVYMVGGVPLQDVALGSAGVPVYRDDGRPLDMNNPLHRLLARGQQRPETVNPLDKLLGRGATDEDEDDPNPLARLLGKSLVELNVWERFATKRIGKEARPFKTAAIPAEFAVIVEDAVKGAKNEAEVKAIFHEARSTFTRRRTPVVRGELDDLIAEMETGIRQAVEKAKTKAGA